MYMGKEMVNEHLNTWQKRKYLWRTRDDGYSTGHTGHTIAFLPMRRMEGCFWEEGTARACATSRAPGEGWLHLIHCCSPSSQDHTYNTAAVGHAWLGKRVWIQEGDVVHLCCWYYRSLTKGRMNSSHVWTGDITERKPTSKSITRPRRNMAKVGQSASRVVFPGTWGGRLPRTLGGYSKCAGGRFTL